MSGLVRTVCKASTRFQMISNITRRYTTIQTPTEITPSHDPLHPTIRISDLGLPLTPQTASLPTSSEPTLSSSDLERLHRLSALNPPAKGSREETELLEGLNELVGLMEAVKAVNLPEGEGAVRDLLTQGVQEVVVGEITGEGGVGEEVKGRQLLGWATRRKGDYYHSKAGKRAD